jgi:hypothetical protein
MTPPRPPSTFNQPHCPASWMETYPHWHLCAKAPGHRDAHVCSGCGKEFVPVAEWGDAYEGL